MGPSCHIGGQSGVINMTRHTRAAQMPVFSRAKAHAVVDVQNMQCAQSTTLKVPSDERIVVAFWLAGNVDVVKALLNAGAVRDLDRATMHGTPLVCAAEHGHRDAAWALICAGAKLNVADSRGWTPLTHTAYKGDAELASALLLNGADSQITADGNCAPLEKALTLDRVDVVRVLLKSRAVRLRGTMVPTKGLFVAALYGSSKSLRELILAGAEVNASTPSFYRYTETPISFAAQFGHAHVIHILAAAGADVHHADGDGNTPLLKAADYPSVECVRVLLHWGAKEDHKNKKGADAAHFVKSQGNPDADREKVSAVLAMLARAPADRAWRRRGWLTMLYARRREQHMEYADDHGDTRPHPWSKIVKIGTSDQHDIHACLKRFHSTVVRLTDFEPSVFRAVVSFL